MNFGVSDNSCMFVTFYAKGTITNEKYGDFYILLTTLIYKIRLFKSHVSRSFSKLSVPLARMRGEQPFLYSNNSNFVDTMPKENKDLKCDAIVVSTSQPKRTISKLEKEIIAIQKKVSKLQDECKNERNEKYRLLCYINRYCSALFPYFDKKNPVDSKNWERVHRLQLDLEKEIK